MAKAKYVNTSRMADSMDVNLQQDVDITESFNEHIDPDLLLRSFGISDDFVNDMAELYSDSNSKPPQQSGVIIKNNQIGGNSSSAFSPVTSPPPPSNFHLTNLQNIIMTTPSQQSFNSYNNQQQNSSNSNLFSPTTNSSLMSPVTLQQRLGDANNGMSSSSPKETCHVTLPFETLQNLLRIGQSDHEAISNMRQQYPITEDLGTARKRSYKTSSHQENPQERQQSGGDQKYGISMSQIFSVPSPVALSPIYVEQKPSPQNDELMSYSMMSPKCTPRPSPASTPPPLLMETQREREYKKRHDSGRCTPIGKRSRPQTPNSDCDSDGSYRDREPLAWSSTGRVTPTEAKPTVRLEDLVDEDKYNKRKRSTSGGEREKDPTKKKDPMKAMLEQLQSHIPHIGNPDEEKVSHAGLLVEASDYIRSLMRENNTTKESVEALKLKIEQLNAEIEDFQMKLPEHGSSSIHRIVSTRGKSIPDMFADHVRQKTQKHWPYWVFTSIMGHFVHSFAQDVSNISPKEMENTSIDWLSERMSLQQLRKDAFRKLAKLCSKTSIMEDPLKLPAEARGFVALTDTEPPETSAERDSYGGKF